MIQCKKSMEAITVYVSIPFDSINDTQEHFFFLQKVAKKILFLNNRELYYKIKLKKYITFKKIKNFSKFCQLRDLETQPDISLKEMEIYCP